MNPQEELRREWDEHWRKSSADEIYPISSKAADWWLSKLAEREQAVKTKIEELENQAEQDFDKRFMGDPAELSGYKLALKDVLALKQ